MRAVMLPRALVINASMTLRSILHFFLAGEDAPRGTARNLCPSVCIRVPCILSPGFILLWRRKRPSEFLELGPFLSRRFNCFPLKLLQSSAMLRYSRAVRPREHISLRQSAHITKIGFATERLLKTKTELASLVQKKLLTRPARRVVSLMTVGCGARAC